MAMFFINLIVFMLFGVFMAIGLIIAGKPVKGSCGGMNNIGLDECTICGKKLNEKDPANEGFEDLSYEVVSSTPKTDKNS